MKKTLSTITQTLACASIALTANFAMAEEKPDTVTVGYYLEWPTANMSAQINKTYDKQMGVEVEWRAFDNGAAMSAAMASGDVDISYSQGLVPFAVAVSQGLPIKMIGVAVSYAENDNCVVHSDTGVTQQTAKDLEGKAIAVPFGTVAHYKMLKTLVHLNVDINNIRLLDMPPADGAAAITRGDVAMACGWGGALRRMKEHGEVLMTAKEQEAIGIRVFDVVSSSERFLNQYPEMAARFLQVTNDSYKDFTNNPAQHQALIAKASGMELEDSNQVLALFNFPLRDEQLSEEWMGGTVQKFTKEVADFFVKHKQIPRALNDYSATIDTSFYQNVN